MAKVDLMSHNVIRRSNDREQFPLTFPLTQTLFPWLLVGPELAGSSAA